MVSTNHEFRSTLVHGMYNYYSHAGIDQVISGLLAALEMKNYNAAHLGYCMHVYSLMSTFMYVHVLLLCLCLLQAHFSLKCTGKVHVCYSSLEVTLNVKLFPDNLLQCHCSLQLLLKVYRNCCLS